MRPALALVALLLSALAVSTALAGPSSIVGVVASLSSFQTYSGGFAPVEDGQPALEATEQALFLASLFGGKSQLNLEAAGTFLASCATSDNGYSNLPGGSSDLASTYNAILAYKNLGKNVPNPTGVGSYIDSLWDQDTKLYGASPGAPGDLKASALALQSLELLGALSSRSEQLKALKATLKALETEASGVRSFSATTEDNANCLIIAALVGYDFGADAQAWARYFYARQNAQGGFNAVAEVATTEGSYPQDAAAAIQALHVLGKTTKAGDLVAAIDSRSLLQFVHRQPRSLAAAFFGYKALARTRALNDVFQSQLALEPTDPRHRVTIDRVIAGSVVRPIFLVRTAWGTWHSGFDVSLTIKQAKESQTMKLQWNAEGERYTGELWDASGVLGRVNFETTLRLSVPDLGDDVIIKLPDTKSVGYDISVVTKANYNGREVDVGGSVGAGAEFAFTVELGSVSEPKPALLQGDFDVTFQVKDAALTVIHEAKIDARQNTAPFAFTYTLTKVNLPAGSLFFTFSVASHSTERVAFQLPVQNVAAEIKFSAPEYKLGEDVTVTMVPATLVGNTLQPFDAYDAKGKQSARRFFMDIVSPTGEQLSTVAATPDVDDADKLFYTFTYSIGASFDSIGANGVAFRFQAADGTSSPLANYNSALGELFEEGRQLGFAVRGDLRLSDVSGPKLPASGKLEYGQTLSMAFSVKDKVSGKPISAVGGATVFLVLRGKDKQGQSYISSRVAATSDSDEPGKYAINWLVNPNAERGKATLGLLALGADGKEIPIVDEGGKAWTAEVEVGGDVRVEEAGYARAVVDARSSDQFALFFINFRLFSADTPLPAADLLARVTGPTGLPLALVAVSEGVDSDGENLGYQVSWTLPSQDAPAGLYSIEIFRESDRKRLAAAEPFFTLSLKYTGSSASWLPFRTEFFVIALLAGAFVFASLRKAELTKK